MKIVSAILGGLLVAVLGLTVLALVFSGFADAASGTTAANQNEGWLFLGLSQWDVAERYGGQSLPMSALPVDVSTPSVTCS